MEFTLGSHSWYALCILITCFPPCFSSEWVWHSCLLWRQKEIIPLCFVLTQAVTPEWGTGAGTCRAWWIFTFSFLRTKSWNSSASSRTENKHFQTSHREQPWAWGQLGLAVSGTGQPLPLTETPPTTPSQCWALAPDTDGNLGRRSSDLRSTSSREPKIAGRS